MNVRARSWLRDGLLWHEPRSLGWSAAATLVIVVLSLVIARAAWSVDGTSLADTHAVVSLDLATARAFCGVPSSFSHHIRIPVEIAARMALRTVPLRTLIADRAGSVEAYCRSVDEPFVNSENSLMLLESALLRLRPGVSLSQLGEMLHLIRIGCVAAFVLLLLDLGSSVALAFATLLCGLMILKAMPDFVYSNYPFLFTLVLLAVALHGFAVRYRWTDRRGGLVWYGAAAGVLSAFIANMRTSYLPVVLLFFACVLIDDVRARGRALSWRARTVRGALLAACFAIAFVGFQRGLITRYLPDEASYRAVHPFGHPLVLALAVPENDFSRAQGIRWADEAGPEIAQRVDPAATFMGPRYNAALLAYYRGLWRTHPGDMLRVYWLKFSVAGADMLRVLRASPGVAGHGVSVLLTPLALLPNGVWMLALYTAIGAASFVRYYRRGAPAAFALGLLTLAACLVQVESAITFSIFVKQYHNYAAFFAMFLSLAGVQGLVNAVLSRAATPAAESPAA